MAKPKLEKFITPKGTAVYPRLNQPDTKFKPEGEFSAKVRLSAEDSEAFIAKIDASIEQTYKAEQEKLIAAGKKGAAKTLKYADKPYKAVLDDEGDATGEYEFNIKMRHNITKKDGTKMQLKPKLFDAKGNPLPASVQIWGGSLIKVAGEFNPFATAIGVGVSLRLSAVQVINLVSSGGGNADSYGFGKEDGYEAEGSELNDDDEGGGAAGYAEESDDF